VKGGAKAMQSVLAITAALGARAGLEAFQNAQKAGISRKERQQLWRQQRRQQRKAGKL
jgi:hypothetical protein